MKHLSGSAQKQILEWNEAAPDVEPGKGNHQRAGITRSPLSKRVKLRRKRNKMARASRKAQRRR